MKSIIFAFLVAIGLIAAGNNNGSQRPGVPALASARPSSPAGGALQPLYAEVDYRAVPGTASNTNGMLEAHETVQVAPFWTNVSGSSQTFTGTASNIAGPPGPAYGIIDATANYGTIGNTATGDCNSATGNCYILLVTGPRPVPHWDLTFDETLSFGSIGTTWTVHIGGSFGDVPTTQQFYSYIEMLFHMGVTGGCGGGNYCPTSPVTRAQMAVFLLKSEHGSSYVPPACSSTVFGDVPCPGGQFVDWINQLALEGITGGCGGGNYCPNDPVTRAQMAVFLLKTEHGSSYVPPACTQIFGDVPCPSLFADWISQLFNEGITGGCGGGNYCPSAPNNRGQMAVFLVRMFGPPAPPVPTPTPLPPTLTPTPVTPTLTPTITPTVPSPTLTPTVPSPTLTPTVPSPTSTPITPTKTNTPGPDPTITLTFTKTFTSVPTNTFTPNVTITLTPSKTNTPITPTKTPTPNPNHVVFVGPSGMMKFVDSISGTSNTTIHVGETVEWQWQGSPHSSTSGTCTAVNCTPDGIWTSGQHNAGFIYTRTFNTADLTYPYFCTVHTVNMTGVIIVNP